jgi:beta-phosphoglucomutase
MKGIIFDMDGVIVNNNPYHKKAWFTFCEKHDIPINDTIFHKLYGRNNRDTLNILFNGKKDNDEIADYAKEKESIYRGLYEKHIEPVPGLINILNLIKQKNLKISLASSAEKENINFILGHLSIWEYFDIITDSVTIKNGKPDPEIYLTTARSLKIKPQDCMVFEDSLSGIESAVRAGMKVIGIETTHSKEEMINTEFTISDFNSPLLLSFIEDIPE